MEDSFRFKQFTVRNISSALKVGTDAVLLGASMSVPQGVCRMLDIGTGSGVLALMAAQRSSEARIDGIDIDEASAREAAYNFETSPWSGRLNSICVPLSSFTPAEPYGMIFSNPPFYDNSLVNPDRRESVARHTESLSYREICRFASENLTRTGILSMILPSQCETELRRCAGSYGLEMFRIIRIKTTPAKGVRRIVAEFSRLRRPLVEEELILQEGESRTEAYRELTSAFYL